MKKSLLFYLLTTLLWSQTASADPKPGDIFKEFIYKKKTDFFNGPFNHLDSVVTELSIDDLDKATRVEVAFYYWGGHSGTAGQEFRANNGGRYKITQPVVHAGNPECYYRTVAGRSAVEIPLNEIRTGKNKFTFYCGKQICHDFNWPHYWIYKYMVRVYYANGKKSEKGQIISPQKGQVIGDYPDLELKVLRPDSVARVDFIAYYTGFDIDGDGKYRDWQYQVKDANWAETAAFSIKPRYKEVWNNYWIPDQDSTLRFMAKITDKNGYSYMTEAIDDVKLVRRDRSVKMYMPDAFPEAFAARKEQRRECTIPVSDFGQGEITDARMFLSTWSAGVDNESPFHEIGINDITIGNKFGIFHDHSLDMLRVPVQSLRKQNKVHLYSTYWGHALEVNYPGPALLVERCTKKECAVAKSSVEVDTRSGTYPVVHIENAVFKGTIRENKGGAFGIEHALRDWTLKSNNLNQAGVFIDACAQRGPLKKATVLHQGKDSAKLRLEYQDAKAPGINAVSEYTFYTNSPFIRIDYVQYPDGWWNTVDIGRPGGASHGVYKIYGQEDFIRRTVQYPESYWNTYDKGYETDPKDAGVLNYKGYAIMLIGDLASQSGFGRIIPIKSAEQGGMKILKLLNRRGFETFPSTGEKAKPYSSAIFVFDQGLEKAMEQAKQYIDNLKSPF